MTISELKTAQNKKTLMTMETIWTKESRIYNPDVEICLSSPDDDGKHHRNTQSHSEQKGIVKQLFKNNYYSLKLRWIVEEYFTDALSS